MQHVVAIVQQPSSPPPLRKKEIRDTAVMFLMGLGLSAVVLVVSLLLLRARTQRARVARAMGVEERRSRSRRNTVDPWSESARRLEVEPDDHDTVDLDPRDLGPDDIEPREPPHNGKGERSP